MSEKNEASTNSEPVTEPESQEVTEPTHEEKEVQRSNSNSDPLDQTREKVSKTPSPTVAANKPSVVPSKGTAQKPSAVSKVIGSSDTGQTAVETAQKAKAAVAAVQSAAHSAVIAGKLAVAVLLNPVTWVVAAVVAAVIAASIGVIGLVQVVGSNENIDNCPAAVGAGAVNWPTDDNMEAARQALADWLMSTPIPVFDNKPMTRDQAIGVLGNVHQESRFNPGLAEYVGSGGPWVTPDTPNDVVRKAGSVSHRAIGLMQWDGARRIALLDYADSQGKLWSDPSVQLNYFLTEMTPGHYNGDRIVRAGYNDPGKKWPELTELWRTDFEVGAGPEPRQRYAAEADAAISGGGGGTVLVNLGGGGTTDGSCGPETSLTGGEIVQTAQGPITVYDVPGFGKLSPELAAVAPKMQALAASQGVTLTGGGFRTAESQIQLRRAHCGSSYYAIYQAPASSCRPPTARPGTSNHEQGKAIDFHNCTTRSTACYQWLARNAEQFGLYNLPSEPWHWSVDGR
jgi:hypothetical protein